MTAQNPPSEPASQLQWLVDRAAISDLLVDFARALDEHDFEGYAANYAPEGVLGFGGTIAHEGREGLAEFVRKGPGRYAATHHLGSNISIAIDGDTAATRSYIVAAHVFDLDDKGRHFDGGGTYHCELRRTDEGWKFTRVMLDIVFTTGDAPQHSGPPRA